MGQGSLALFDSDTCLDLYIFFYEKSCHTAIFFVYNLIIRYLIIVVYIPSMVVND